MSDDDLSQTRLFLRIVEAGSLRAVAVERGLEPSTVTRRLAALEARLGVRLIRRSRTRSVPTDAGQLFYERMRPLADQVDAIEAEVTGAATVPKGLLRIAAPVDFGARFVAPVATLLADAHPGLTVDLRLGTAFADMVVEGIDVAVRIGRLQDSSLIARRLADIPRVLAAAPVWRDRLGPIDHPSALATAPFVFYRPGQTRAELSFRRDAETVTVEVAGRLAVNNVSAITAMVVAGSALHLGPRWAFADALTNGRVVDLLPAWTAAPLPLNVLMPPTPYQPAKTRAFVAALRARLRMEPALAGG